MTAIPTEAGSKGVDVNGEASHRRGVAGAEIDKTDFGRVHTCFRNRRNSRAGRPGFLRACRQSRDVPGVRDVGNSQIGYRRSVSHRHAVREWGAAVELALTTSTRGAYLERLRKDNRRKSGPPLSWTHCTRTSKSK